MPQLSTVLTADGSQTVYSERFGEHYHSTFGAMSESNHVFIDAGLKLVLENKQSIRILEIGFGTGLNALLTYRQTNDSHLIHYTGIELFPLPREITQQIDFALSAEDKSTIERFHACSWNEFVPITTHFRLKKWHIDFTKHPDFTEMYDLIYFDAFAPDVQPEMWTSEIFRSLYENMNIGAVLTTYCAKGQVRRNMREAGFSTERLPGPPGKREMLRARKI